MFVSTLTDYIKNYYIPDWNEYRDRPLYTLASKTLQVAVNFFGAPVEILGHGYHCLILSVGYVFFYSKLKNETKLKMLASIIINIAELLKNSFKVYIIFCGLHPWMHNRVIKVITSMTLGLGCGIALHAFNRPMFERFTGRSPPQSIEPTKWDNYFKTVQPFPKELPTGCDPKSAYAEVRNILRARLLVPSQTCYGVLGFDALPRDDTSIKSTFRRLAPVIAPDRNGQTPQLKESEQLFQIVKTAYECSLIECLQNPTG